MHHPHFSHPLLLHPRSPSLTGLNPTPCLTTSNPSTPLPPVNSGHALTALSMILFATPPKNRTPARCPRHNVARFIIAVVGTREIDHFVCNVTDESDLPASGDNGGVLDAAESGGAEAGAVDD
ncbi:hypothetical protein GRF29_8g1682838 [Pseudopithomyces chartarum]|uniref:Uncharacterized protein n=1 Tax=Pseudopithomyces chartarum TaxID=1892770 RepID=A0AAN6M407_9PLEO|nr:hypothetical protein GRF29_8g1682838 [Pseudopithomyces chartarum]